MDSKRLLHSGQLYDSSLCDLVDEQQRLLEKLYDFNATRPSQQEERQRLMKEMFGDIGKDCYIEPPLYSNWACKHVHFGDSVYANFSLTLVDDTHIYVGSHTMIGPNVTIPRMFETAQRDLRAIQRAGTHRRKLPDRRGRDRAPRRDDRGQNGHRRGQRVTRDIPSNVVAVGSPCMVMRPIDERDEEVYFRGKKIPEELKKRK